MTSSIARLGEVFKPDQPVEEQSFLFGRSEELRKLMIAFESSAASVPVLVGPAGIGKTSMFAMLRQILVGYPAVLDARGLGLLKPSEMDRLVIGMRCDSALKDESDLSAAITEIVGSAMNDRTKRRTWSLRGVDVEASVHFVKVKSAWEVEARERESPTRELSRRLTSISESGPIRQIVILLDECEQLGWVERLLDYTRNFPQDVVKFCLAIRDHAAGQLASPARGDYRWPHKVPINRLSNEDIADLYEYAGKMLRALGIRWSLNDEALAHVELHSGHEPWYLQMMGHSLIFDPKYELASERVTLGSPRTIRVSLDDVKRAEHDIVETRLSTLHSDRYYEVTDRAPRREELLRALAKFPGTIVPTRFIKEIVSKRITSAARIVDKMATGDDPVLLKIPGGWQFADHQFRVFCRLSPASSTGIDELAKYYVDAWNHNVS